MEPGKSHPFNEKICDFALMAVQDKSHIGIKFVKVVSKELEKNYSVFLFMDNKASDLEINEWQSFNSRIEEFKSMGINLIGVCTDSHVAVRAFMIEHHLTGIKFPIISDKTGALSKSFGVLKTHHGNFGAARAVAVVNDKNRLIFIEVKNEKTQSDPQEIINLIRIDRGEKPEDVIDVSETYAKKRNDAETAKPKAQDEVVAEKKPEESKSNLEEQKSVDQKTTVSSDQPVNSDKIAVCDCQYSELPHSEYLHEVGML